jgi:L-asparaginase
MQSDASTIVVLGTGGTIAGLAGSASDHVGYRAGQVGIEQLLDALPGARPTRIEAEQVAQVDSKDMDQALWRNLAQRAAVHLQRADVAGLVVTHGTDTLEETAYFLHRVLAPARPLVLTAAMRPASALLADGPQNLLDALTVAAHPGARGVLAVLAGNVYEAPGLRKVHPYRLDAFDGGDAGPVARVESGRVRQLRPWPAGPALGQEVIAADAGHWPRIEIVTSHAGASGTTVDALVAQGVDGIVVAGTGNGTVHRHLDAALRHAQDAGVEVRRSTRCAGGIVIAGAADELPIAAAATPVQARIDLLLELLAARRAA